MKFIVGVVLASLVLAGCSLPLGGLPPGKAGLSLDLAPVPRAIAASMDSLTLKGSGPDGTELVETVITNGGTLALNPGAWTFTVFVKDAAGEVLQEDTREAELVRGETTRLSFAVHTRGTISGRLLDGGGLPLAGATLWVANLDTSPATVAEQVITTDADGSFAATDLPRGRLQLFVMDLPSGGAPASNKDWWQPWLVEPDQTGAVVLEDRSPVETELHIWITEPDVGPLAGAPITLIERDTDRTVEHVWSTVYNGRVYFFSRPEVAAQTNYLLRSFHDRYDFGSEASAENTETFWMRREATGWVTFTTSQPTPNEVPVEAVLDGTLAEIVVQLKNSDGVTVLTDTAGYILGDFDVSGPGISGVVGVSKDPDGLVKLTGALPGTYTFTPHPLDGTATHFDPFTVTVDRPGQLIELDKSAHSAVPAT